jgi:hypothetical protein
MAEEIDVVGTIGLRTDRVEFGADRVQTQHGAGQRTQPAGVRDGHGETAALNTRHGRLDHRMRYAQQGLKTCRHRMLLAEDETAPDALVSGRTRDIVPEPSDGTKAAGPSQL